MDRGLSECTFCGRMKRPAGPRECSAAKNNQDKRSNIITIAGARNRVRLLAVRQAAMWRFFDREHLKAICARYGATAGATPAAVIASCLLGPACQAGTLEEQISRNGQADHSIVVREHAGWDMDCAAIDHPALYLDEPPRHGRVCARIQDIKIHAMYVGTQAQCIGHLVRGVQLVYRPDAGYAGDDMLRYAAQYPSVLRTVSVVVTVTAPGAPSPAASSIATPLSQPRQTSGEIPACEDLMF